VSNRAVLPRGASVILTVLLKVLFGLAIIVGALWASSDDAHADGLLDNVIDIVPAVTTTVTTTVTDTVSGTVSGTVRHVVAPVIAVVPKVVQSVPIVRDIATPEAEPVEGETESPVAEKTVIEKPAHKAEPATAAPVALVTAAATKAEPPPAVAETALDNDMPSSPAPVNYAPHDEPTLTVTPSSASSVAELAGDAHGDGVASTVHERARDLAPPGRPTFESDTTPD